MDLTPINVMLQEPLKAFVDVQAIEGGYGTASDYILALVQEAEQRKSADALESLLSEGLDPANRGQMNDAQWSDYVAEHRTQRLSALRKEIDVGIDDLAHGRSYSAEDIFCRLESRSHGSRQL